MLSSVWTNGDDDRLKLVTYFGISSFLIKMGLIVKIIKGEERLFRFLCGIISYFMAVDQLKKNVVSCASISVLTDIQKMLARTQGLPDAGGQVILLGPGEDEQLNFRMKAQIIEGIHLLDNIKIPIRRKIRPGFVIDGGLHPDPIFAEPVPKPADAGPDFNNACKIVAKQLKGSYEFIGEKHKGLSDVGLPDHHGEQLFFSVEVPGFDPLTVSIDVALDLSDCRQSLTGE